MVWVRKHGRAPDFSCRSTSSPWRSRYWRITASGGSAYSRTSRTPNDSIKNPKSLGCVISSAGVALSAATASGGSRQNEVAVSLPRINRSTDVIPQGRHNLPLIVPSEHSALQHDLRDARPNGGPCVCVCVQRFTLCSALSRQGRSAGFRPFDQDRTTRCFQGLNVVSLKA